MKIYKFEEYRLNESPDNPSIYYKGEKITQDNLGYGVREAFPFAYDALSIMYEETAIKNYRRKIKKELENPDGLSDRSIKLYKDKIQKHKRELLSQLKSHGIKSVASFKKLPKKKSKGRNYNMITGYIGEGVTHGGLLTGREEQILNGRIWYNTKIISFWDYPDTYEELIQVIKDIETSYKVQWNKDLNIINNLEDWFIDTKDHSELIKINDYKGGQTKYTEEELKAPHLMNWEEKQEWKKKNNYKGKSSPWKKHMKPFESFSNLT